MLRAKGYAIVDNEFDADTVLLNTCSVRDQAEQKAIWVTIYKRKRKTRTFYWVLWGVWLKTVGIVGQTVFRT